MPQDRARLKSLRLAGYKSIRDLSELEFRPINVLLGANGSGKSNLISFFRLLAWALTSPGRLQERIGLEGGASALLHDGPSVTREIAARIAIETGAGLNDYSFRWAHAAGDTLIYTEEQYRYSAFVYRDPAPWQGLGAGHREAALIAKMEEADRTARTIHHLLLQIVVHQFHDTSSKARIRSHWSIGDGRRLKEDAANLAPFLMRMKDEDAAYYRNVVETLRLVLPFFEDFEFDPAKQRLMLKWRERGTDMVFHAGQAADGMLRVISLVALLLQPYEKMPDVLILDEPELGLHPYAIDTIAELIRAASDHVQFVIATQSTSFIDRFDAKDLIVVERHGRESTFRRLEREPLSDWLSDYTLSELWEKNVIGGRPE